MTGNSSYSPKGRFADNPRTWFVISNLFTHNRALIELHKQHQLCSAQAFLDCAFQPSKNAVLAQGEGPSRPRRLERPKVAAVADEEIRLSAHWQALPPRHCSVRRYAERRHDSDPDSCRPSRLVS